MKRSLSHEISRRDACVGGITLGLGLALKSSPVNAQAKDKESFACITGKVIDAIEQINERIFDEMFGKHTDKDEPPKISGYNEELAYHLRTYQNQLPQPNATIPDDTRRMIRREQQELIEMMEAEGVSTLPNTVAAPTSVLPVSEECMTVGGACIKFILEAFGAKVSAKDVINILADMPEVEKALVTAFDKVKSKDVRGVSNAVSKLLDIIVSKRFFTSIIQHVGNEAGTLLLGKMSAKLVPLLGYAVLAYDVGIAIKGAYDYIESPKC